MGENIKKKNKYFRRKKPWISNGRLRLVYGIFFQQIQLFSYVWYYLFTGSLGDDIHVQCLFASQPNTMGQYIYIITKICHTINLVKLISVYIKYIYYFVFLAKQHQ